VYNCDDLLSIVIWHDILAFHAGCLLRNIFWPKLNVVTETYVLVQYLEYTGETLSHVFENFRFSCLHVNFSNLIFLVNTVINIAAEVM